MGIKIPNTRKVATKRHAIFQYELGRLSVLYWISSSNLNQNNISAVDIVCNLHPDDRVNWQLCEVR